MKTISRRPGSRTIALVLAVLLAAVGLGFALAGRSVDPAGEFARSSTGEAIAEPVSLDSTCREEGGVGSSRPVATSDEAWRYRMSVGEAYRWSFDWSQDLRVESSADWLAGMAEAGAPAARQEAQDVRVEVRGSLRVTPYGSERGTLLLGYAFDRVEFRYVSSAGDIPREGLEAASRALEIEALAVVSNQGDVWGLRFPASASPEVARHLEAILASARVLLPATAQPTWAIEDEDPTGPFEARYEARDAGDADRLRIVRRKVYRPLAAAPEIAPEVEGEARAEFSRGRGLLVCIQGAEVLRIAGRDLPSVVTSRAVYAFRLEGVDRDVVSAGTARARVEAYGSFRPADGLAGEGAVETSDRADEPAGVDTLEDWILAADGEVDGRSFDDLVRLLARDPASARRVATLQGTVREGLERRLIDALGRAGTPAAAETLLALVEDESAGAGHRDQAILAAVSMDEPTQELLAGLQARAEARSSDREAVALRIAEGLGIAASRCARSGREGLAREVVGFLERSLASSGTTEWTAALLLGLGNAGSRESFALVSGHAVDPEPAIRAAAATALRKMERAKALPLLTRLALEDPSDEVRDAAARAFEQLE